MPDERRTIPLALLDPAPWNPKRPLAGKYREGLGASLDHFGVRDDLKVWPNPQAPGRYVALDGNQRLDILREKGLEAVECRILADLDDEDARLFTAAFDRNHAVYDEHKLADLAAGLKASSADLVTALLRPDRPVAPLPPPPPAESFRDGGDVPDATAADFAAEQATTIPFTFALSRDGYEEVRGWLLSSKSRVVREWRLREALVDFSERALDDLVVELALRIRATLAKRDAEATGTRAQESR